MATTAYMLYCNKKEKILKVSPAEKIPVGVKVSSSVSCIDPTHYISTSKDALKRKATELKKEWVEDCKKTLKGLEAIRIV